MVFPYIAQAELNLPCSYMQKTIFVFCFPSVQEIVGLAGRLEMLYVKMSITTKLMPPSVNRMRNLNINVVAVSFHVHSCGIQVLGQRYEQLTRFFLFFPENRLQHFMQINCFLRKQDEHNLS